MARPRVDRAIAQGTKGQGGHQVDQAGRSGPPAAADAPAGERYLLLADISGYSGFMTGVEMAHGVDFGAGIPAAYSVLGDLLDVVIRGVEPDFALVKLEGDAVFAAAPAAGLDGGETKSSTGSGRPTGPSWTPGRGRSRPATTSARPVPRSPTSTSR
jgi:hypothetical protein